VKEKFKRLGWFMTGFLLMMGTHVMAAGSGAVVTDHYKEVVYVEPYTIEVCEQQQVANPDDLINSAFWGAIFGAVVGDAIDDEHGKLPGAIIGAAIGSEEAKKNSTTTAMVCKQETRQQRTVRNVYSHSTIEFEYEGSYYEVNFTKR
jgi:uncharacterized protein YcfJ|tara:strand:- start:199 stop:639 length:441 start_codon:yes stop_codon:yes gene_type:complete